MAGSFRRVRHLAVVHLRYYFCLPAALCVSLLLFTPVVFPPAGLSSQQAAVPLEYLVSLIGIILMVPAASYRQSSRIQDPHDRIVNRDFSMFTVRLLIALGALFLCTGIFTLYLYISGSQVFLFHFTGVFITAFFLGSLGMLVQTLCSRSCAAGYLVPLLYYSGNLLWSSLYGRFTLFSLSQGSFSAKGWLFAAALLFSCVSLFIRKIRCNG